MAELKILSQAWVQLGAIGLFIIVLLFSVWKLAKYIVKKEKCNQGEIVRITGNHREEREVWRKESQEQTQKVINVVDRNSTVISELNILIKSRYNGRN